MSLKTIVTIHDSPYLMQRVTAAAACQQIANPESWVLAHWWEFSATEGWGDKWNNATDEQKQMEGGAGNCEEVITDDDILARVQELAST